MSSPAIRELASRAMITELRLDVLANNISNVNTTGFKEDEVTFRVPNGEADSDGPTGSGISLGATALPFATMVNYSAGQFRQTGNPLDVALRGDGFFCLQAEDGIRYTRNGRFTLSPEGVLTSGEGLPVLGRTGQIRIDGNRIDIGADGSLSVDGMPADTLKIVNFSNPAILKKTGDTEFVPFDRDQAVEETPKDLQVLQGSMEMSNVDPIKTMTRMIEVLRGYESYQKAIQSLNEATLKTINEVGKF